MRLTTWNVLHRIHAVNWREAPVEAFPDERERIAAITEVVSKLLETSDVVCLQEVSGDQLGSLRRELRARATIFDHTYPRLPKLRVVDTSAPLANPTEHLVTLTHRHATLLESETFPSDPGKGLLALRVSEWAIVNTHVSSGSRASDQLRRLTSLAASHDHAALLGDFNAERDVLEPLLGDRFALTNLEGQPATRIATTEKAPRRIDHVVVKRPSIVHPGLVTQVGECSDHRPVSAEIELSPSH